MGVHYIKSTNLQNNYNLKSDTIITSFNRNELNLILSVYGQNVAQGIWKDYAIDHTTTYAVFSIYRNTFERAFISIRKNSIKQKRQKQYIILDVNQKKIQESNRLIDIINRLKSKKFQIV